MSVRFALVGDVHGDFRGLAEALDGARRRFGSLDLILAVGDVEANRTPAEAEGVVGPRKYRKVGDFPEVVTGKLRLGAPFHFIAGNHDPYPTLDENGPGHWASDCFWLGRWGIRGIEGLTVAFLSGIHSPKHSETPAPVRTGPRVRTYWHRSELDALTSLARGSGPIDVLLTHEWPAGVGTTRDGLEAGEPDVRRLVERLRPKVHACGHIHHALNATIGNTTVVCLARATQHRGGIAYFEKNDQGLRRLDEPMNATSAAADGSDELDASPP